MGSCPNPGIDILECSSPNMRRARDRAKYRGSSALLVSTQVGRVWSCCLRPAELENYSKDLPPRRARARDSQGQVPRYLPAQQLQGELASGWVTVLRRLPRAKPKAPHMPTERSPTPEAHRLASAAPLSSGQGNQTCPILQPRCSREGPSLVREALQEDVMAFNL